MQRVLPQLNDRTAIFCRRRMRLFHWENLRRERSRCHQEFRLAQDRHVKTKIIPQLRIVSRLRSMRSDNQSQSLETFKIGRASCRERVKISVSTGVLKKKSIQIIW